MRGKKKAEGKQGKEGINVKRYSRAYLPDALFYTIPKNHVQVAKHIHTIHNYPPFRRWHIPYSDSTE